jgi:hypothetical protein
VIFNNQNKLIAHNNSQVIDLVIVALI